MFDLREHWDDDPDKFAGAVRKRQTYLENELTFQVAVIDAKGLLAFSSLERRAAPIDLSDREHFKVHRDSNDDVLHISKPLLGRVSNRWSIQFSRGIYRDGVFSGVLVFSVSPEYFYRFYRCINIPPSGMISVVHGDGIMLSRYPDPELAMGRAIKNAPYVGELTKQTGLFTRRSPIDGIERIMAWRKLNRYGLVVVAGYSLSEVFSEYQKQWLREVFAAVFLTILLLAVGCLRVRSIAQQQWAARELEANEERWRMALEATGDGVWDWDIPGRQVDYSKGWKRMLGYSPEEIGSGFEEWELRVHPDDLRQVMRDLEEHLDNRSEFFINEHRLRCKDGQWKWILDRGMVVSRDADGNPLRAIGTHTDISSRKRMEEELKELAGTDALTGLHNRRVFFERLDAELERIRLHAGTKAALLMIDIDHFKGINDTYGHAMGDAGLKYLADSIRGVLRETDVLGRIGGEEFGVILPETNAEHAVMLAERLCSIFRNGQLCIGDLAIAFTISIGVSMLKATDRDKEQILSRADAALYQAKTDGRDRVAANI